MSLDMNAPAPAPADPAAKGTPPAAPAPQAPQTPPAPAALDLATPAPAAPAAAPVAPPEPAAVAFAETGDPGLDFALGFLGKLGIGPELPEMQAALSGDFGLLAAKLATMGDKAKGHEQVLALAKQSYERQSSAAQAKVAEATKAVHEAVGGEETWNAIKTWAAESIPEEDRTAISAVLKAGGSAAAIVAEGLRARYAAQPGSTVRGAGVVADGARLAPSATAAGLTAREFTQAVATLARRVGDVDGHPEYKALQARREQARRAGR